MNSPDERGPEQKEEEMKLISNHELLERSESELSALFRAVSEELVRTPYQDFPRSLSLPSPLARIARAQKRACLAGKHQPGAGERMSTCRA
jgi:hypothetical protein